MGAEVGLWWWWGAYLSTLSEWPPALAGSLTEGWGWTCLSWPLSSFLCAAMGQPDKLERRDRGSVKKIMLRSLNIYS